jgi:hypothetical protein
MLAGLRPNGLEHYGKNQALYYSSGMDTLWQLGPGVVRLQKFSDKLCNSREKNPEYEMKASVSGMEANR